MKRLLVIGASGLVGSRFEELAKEYFDMTDIDQNYLDITDSNAVNNFFSKYDFDSVVNFAAFTNVDAAEKERGDENGLVGKLNVEGPKNLSEICKQKNIHFIQISTDFVFDTEGPFSEDQLTAQRLNDKISWYGWTKNRGEVGDTIVRFSYPFRAKFDNKVDWARKIIKLYNNKKLYPLFADQIYSILLIDDLVGPLSKIINDKLTGVFHIVSHDTTTPHESAMYLLEKYSGHPVEIPKGLMEEFLKTPGRTPRPIKGGLKTEKTEKRLGMKFKTWREMVDDFLSQNKN